MDAPIIHGIANVRVRDGADCDPHTGKPYLEVTFGDVVVCMTTNLAEMLGGAGSGTRKRFEDLKRAPTSGNTN